MTFTIYSDSKEKDLLSLQIKNEPTKAQQVQIKKFERSELVSVVINFKPGNFMMKAELDDLTDENCDSIIMVVK